VRRPGLTRGLVFALIAGLGAAFWMLLAAPLLGYSRAAGLYGLGLIPWYGLAVAPTARRGAAAFLLGLVLALPGVLLDPRPALVFGLTPFILGIQRSAILFPRPFARAVFLELAFGALALLLAAFFFDSGVAGTTFAFWSFWLVQAGFTLAPGEPEPATDAPGDAFDDAHSRALALLERRGR
jgi:hypothetical protein